MRQKTLRVFEVDDFESLKKIIDSKYELVKKHIFMLKEKNAEVEDLLKSKNLSYFVLNDEGFTPQKEISTEIKIIEREIVKEIKRQSIIFDKIIRSGEEIKSNDNLVFLNRINAGAKITCSANVELFAECEGFVKCEGDYLIVKKNVSGTIIFKGENIGKVDKLTIFTDKYKKVLE